VLIQEFSRVTGLGRATIRFYVRKRLLRPAIGAPSHGASPAGRPTNRYLVFDAGRRGDALKRTSACPAACATRSRGALPPRSRREFLPHRPSLPREVPPRRTREPESAARACPQPRTAHHRRPRPRNSPARYFIGARPHFVVPAAGVIVPQGRIIVPSARFIAPEARVMVPEAPVMLPIAHVIGPSRHVIGRDARIIGRRARVIRPGARLILPHRHVTADTCAFSPRCPVAAPGRSRVRPAMSAPSRARVPDARRPAGSSRRGVRVARSSASVADGQATLARVMLRRST